MTNKTENLEVIQEQDDNQIIELSDIDLETVVGGAGASDRDMTNTIARIENKQAMLVKKIEAPGNELLNKLYSLKDAWLYQRSYTTTIELYTPTKR